MTDMPTTMWIPSCRAHAPQFAYWATTQVVALGHAELFDLDEARRLPKRFAGGRLAAPFDASPLVGGVEQQVVSTEWQGVFEIPFEDGGEVFSRSVGPALPLPIGSDQGRAAEIAVFDAAATWGMPDFAFKPLLHHRGSGIREVGDAILLLHDIALVVQVKRRESVTDETAREIRWLHKAAAKALKQSNGSLRTLGNENLKLENARQETFEVRPDDRRWYGVILIDHPDLPSNELALGDSRTLVLTRRDWEFLFAQLKSTHAVARYIEVVLELDPVALGNEPIRYHQLAAASAALNDEGPSEDPELRRHFTEGQGIPTSIFPQMPVSAPIRERVDILHSFFRTLQEDLAHVEDDVDVRHEMLSRLDSLPPAVKEYFARTVLGQLDEAYRLRRRDTGTWGRLRMSDGYPQMVYVVATKSIEDAMPVLAAFQAYEHYKFARVDNFSVSAVTMGLLISPRTHGPRPWEAFITMSKGDPEVSETMLSDFKEMFGPYWDDDDRTGLVG